MIGLCIVGPMFDAGQNVDVSFQASSELSLGYLVGHPTSILKWRMKSDLKSANSNFDLDGQPSNFGVSIPRNHYRFEILHEEGQPDTSPYGLHSRYLLRYCDDISWSILDLEQQRTELYLPNVVCHCGSRDCCGNYNILRVEEHISQRDALGSTNGKLSLL